MLPVILDITGMEYHPIDRNKKRPAACGRLDT